MEAPGSAPLRETEEISTAGLELRVDEKFDRLYQQLKEEEFGRAILWGGFMRRGCAFFVDLLVLFFLSLFLFYGSYIAFRVGMAFHDSPASLDASFLALIAGAWITLGAVYFVLFHAMGGQTIGKWVFGLRVVGAKQHPVTYLQAFVRWLIALIFAPVGLGFLWIIWHKEKRAWHDLLAGTWVVRDRSPSPNAD
ncbi:MAG: RDD family protein [Deltaproteobacteria bacterium]|nr:RDD family protein [Deltaproteobacteria bacterium]